MPVQLLLLRMAMRFHFATCLYQKGLYAAGLHKAWRMRMSQLDVLSRSQASLSPIAGTTVVSLVTFAGVCEERLYRVLRAAVQIGLFQAVLPKKNDPGVKFKNNKCSALLRDGHPNCLKNMVGHLPHMLSIAHSLLDIIRHTTVM